MAANARGARDGAPVAGVTKPAALTTAQQRTRRLFRYLAAAFTAGLTMQVFIVGIALFVDAGRWGLHQRLGHALTLIPILMLGLALAGRMTTSTKLLAGVAVALVVLQMITASIGGWAGVVHPINAFLLIGLGLQLYRQGSGSRSGTGGDASIA